VTASSNNRRIASRARRYFSEPMTEQSKILTYPEVLELLTEQARAGSTTAACALERALRPVGGHHEPNDEFDEIFGLDDDSDP
jgi:hypothetical protein